jgi:hypothetical protein
MAHGGRVAILGIPTAPVELDLDPVIFNMLTLKGIYGREMYETWYQMSVMIDSGLDIAPVITHRFPYTEFEQGSRSRARRLREGAPRLEGCVDVRRVRDDLRARLDELESDGPAQRELVMTTPQGAHVDVEGAASCLNLCANNYLGLANHPEMVAAAHEALDRWGYGMASVRFICGTQALHRELEERLSAFLGTEDTILFSSCFDANGGVFEALLDERDAVISDQLNHASIIDGHPALQGAPRALRERRHGRARGRARRLRRRRGTG